MGLHARRAARPPAALVEAAGCTQVPPDWGAWAARRAARGGRILRGGARFGTVGSARAERCSLV